MLNLPDNPSPADILAAAQALVAQAKKEKRAAQARVNGAQSKGPITPEGKARSSRSALKHGFAAKINILIEPDDSEAWDAHLAGYRDSYRPTNYAENDLVDELAYTSWCKARVANIQSALIDFQLSVQESKVEECFPEERDNPRLHLALAWQALARKPLPRFVPVDPSEPIDPSLPPDELDVESFELARRYMTSLDRQFRNALLNLRQYRKDFAPPPSAPVDVAVPPPSIQIRTPQPRPAQNEPTKVESIIRKTPAAAAGPLSKTVPKAPEVAA